MKIPKTITIETALWCAFYLIVIAGFVIYFASSGARNDGEMQARMESDSKLEATVETVCDAAKLINDESSNKLCETAQITSNTVYSCNAGDCTAKTSYEH